MKKIIVLIFAVQILFACDQPTSQMEEDKKKSGKEIEKADQATYDVPDFWFVEIKTQEDFQFFASTFKDYFKNNNFDYSYDEDSDISVQDRFFVEVTNPKYTYQFHFPKGFLNNKKFEGLLKLRISCLFSSMEDDENAKSIKDLQKRLNQLKKSLNKIHIVDKKFENLLK